MNNCRVVIECYCNICDDIFPITVNFESDSVLNHHINTEFSELLDEFESFLKTKVSCLCKIDDTPIIKTFNSRKTIDFHVS